MQRIKKTKGIVIKKNDFRDTSLLVTFYTRDFGKIKTIVKGIKKDYRKFASHLNAFSINDIVFYEKHPRDFCILSQADLNCANVRIFNSVRKIATAFYLAEFVDKITLLFDKNEALFELLLQVYSILEQDNRGNEEKLLRIFEIKFLELSGFKPKLDACVSCQNVITRYSRFSMLNGGLLCPKCYSKDKSARSISQGTIATMTYIESNNWKNILRLSLTADTAGELKEILRDFLDFHLEHKIKSERFLGQLN